MSDPQQETQIHVVSIYGAQTRRGLVELTVGETVVLVPPAKAREVAAMLIECATAAEGDEALMLVTDRAGISPQRAMQLLRAMRQERHLIFQKARREAREAIAYDQFTTEDETGL